MSRFERLREQHRDLWERVVEHDFARELGDDSLPLEKFQRYFVQDYAFFQDFVVLIALGIAKAPNMDAARPLAGFLHEILQGEEVLFTKTFESWGWPPEHYRGAAPGPTALALGNLMGRTAYEGGFAEILTVLAVTEGTYLDWPARNRGARRRPQNAHLPRLDRRPCLAGVREVRARSVRRARRANTHRRAGDPRGATLRGHAPLRARLLRHGLRRHTALRPVARPFRNPPGSVIPSERGNLSPPVGAIRESPALALAAGPTANSGRG